MKELKVPAGTGGSKVDCTPIAIRHRILATSRVFSHGRSASGPIKFAADAPASVSMSAAIVTEFKQVRRATRTAEIASECFAERCGVKIGVVGIASRSNWHTVAALTNCGVNPND